MEQEIWRDMKGYEGIYRISSQGQVMSIARIDNKGHNLKDRVLTAKRCTNGYLFQQLCKDGIKRQILLHRLVAANFIDNPDNLAYVNHKDGVRTNNRVDNLEWCTPSDNNKHIYRVLGHTNPGRLRVGKLNHNARAVCMKDLEGNTIKLFECARMAAEELAISAGMVNACCRGTRRLALVRNYTLAFSS